MANDIEQRITDATTYYSLFGSIPAGSMPEPYIQSLYRKMARIVHPDVSTAPTDLFQKLTKFYNDALVAISHNRYGQSIYLATIKSKRATHSILARQRVDNLCDYYSAESNGSSTGRPSIVKIVKQPKNNDLLEQEASILNTLYKSPTYSQYDRFIPQLIDSFPYPKTRRRVNVFEIPAGEWYSFVEIRKNFPSGISMLDGAWIWRRMLFALSHIHDSGVIHGALLPENIWVLPDDHGLMLLNWCYGVTGTPIKALVPDHESWYPQEVTDRLPAGPATDVYMATKSLIYLTGGDPTSNLYSPTSKTPKPFQSFFKGCLTTNQKMRPNDANELLAEFDLLLKEIGEPYYPRRFHRFVMKGQTTNG